jgi:hypothetical protein
MTDPKTETQIGWKQRFKLSLTMWLGSIIAWIRPQEIQRVLDDHLAAAEKRRYGSQEGRTNPLLNSALSELDRRDFEGLAGGSKPTFTTQELKAVAMAVNLAKRGKRKKAALADTSITVEDARLILDAYFAHLAAQSSKLQSAVTDYSGASKSDKDFPISPPPSPSPPPTMGRDK